MSRLGHTAPDEAPAFWGREFLGTGLPVAVFPLHFFHRPLCLSPFPFLGVIVLVLSQVEADVEVSALVPVVVGAVAAGAAFAGNGVCCALAIPEHSARASADSASIVFNRGKKFSWRAKKADGL